MHKYKNRKEAGKALAVLLKEHAERPDVLVLALPRGGVPVAFEVAKALSLTWDIFIVRKLGAPMQEEYAMGAIASGGTVLYNKELIEDLHINASQMEKVIQAERKELLRREKKYRGKRPFPQILNKTIILVDDGIATGFSMQAAIQAIKTFQPAKIIVAAPVGARSTCIEMASQVDQLVCPSQPVDFYAVGLWYEEFPQVSDEEVLAFLDLRV